MSDDTGIPGGPYGPVNDYSRPWPDRSGAMIASMGQPRPLVAMGYVSASKLISYAITWPIGTGVGASKFVSYAVLGPPGAAFASKFIGYAVLGPPPAAFASKFIAYAIIETTPVTFNRRDRMQPLPPPVPRLRDYFYSYSTPPALIPPAPSYPTVSYDLPPRPRPRPTGFEAQGTPAAPLVSGPPPGIPFFDPPPRPRRRRFAERFGSPLPLLAGRGDDDVWVQAIW